MASLHHKIRPVMLVVELGGPTMFARIGVMRALNTSSACSIHRENSGDDGINYSAQMRRQALRAKPLWQAYKTGVSLSVQTRQGPSRNDPDRRAVAAPMRYFREGLPKCRPDAWTHASPAKCPLRVLLTI